MWFLGLLFRYLTLFRIDSELRHLNLIQTGFVHCGSLYHLNWRRRLLILRASTLRRTHGRKIMLRIVYFLLFLTIFTWIVRITDNSQCPGNMVLIDDGVWVDLIDLGFWYLMMGIIDVELVGLILALLFTFAPFSNLTLDQLQLVSYQFVLTLFLVFYWRQTTLRYVRLRQLLILPFCLLWFVASSWVWGCICSESVQINHLVWILEIHFFHIELGQVKWLNLAFYAVVSLSRFECL